MTRFLAQLADTAYRRRGRVVLAWIAAMVVIIGVGACARRRVQGRLRHPRLGVEGRERPDRGALRRLLRPGDLRRLEGRGRAPPAPPPASASTRFFAEAEQVDHVSPHTPVRISEDGTIGSTHPAADRPRLGGPQGGRREADRRRRGQQRRRARDQARRRPDLRGAGGDAAPRDSASSARAIVLLIAFGSVVAAGLPLDRSRSSDSGSRPAGLILLLANVVDVPDWTTAVSGLIGIGVGIDYALLVLTRFRAAMHDGKDRHDAVVEAVTTAGRSVIIAGLHRGHRRARPRPHRPPVHVRRRPLGLARRAGRDARVGHAAAGPALLPGPEGRPLAHPVPRAARCAPRATADSPAARWSHAVQRRPWPAAIIATAILLALAAPALGMRLGFPDAGNDPPDTMTRQAYDLNTEGFGPGSNGPLVIAAELPDLTGRGPQRLRGAACAGAGRRLRAAAR